MRHSRPSAERLIELQRLLLKFNQIERTTHRRRQGKFVHDNDTEHSYNLTLTAWFLGSHFPELDCNKLIRFALVHDLVEIHAGDTYAYGDTKILSGKEARERAALKKLQDEWLDFPELIEEIKQYEKKDTPEARFVYALDKILPMMLNYINDGYSWQQDGVTLKMIHSTKKDKVAVSPEIEPYYKSLYKLLSESPHLLPLT